MKNASSSGMLSIQQKVGRGPRSIGCERVLSHKPALSFKSSLVLRNHLWTVVSAESSIPLIDEWFLDRHLVDFILVVKLRLKLSVADFSELLSFMSIKSSGRTEKMSVKLDWQTFGAFQVPLWSYVALWRIESSGRPRSLPNLFQFILDPFRKVRVSIGRSLWSLISLTMRVEGANRSMISQSIWLLRLHFCCHMGLNKIFLFLDLCFSHSSLGIVIWRDIVVSSGFSYSQPWGVCLFYNWGIGLDMGSVSIFHLYLLRFIFDMFDRLHGLVRLTIVSRPHIWALVRTREHLNIMLNENPVALLALFIDLRRQLRLSWFR